MYTLVATNSQEPVLTKGHTLSSCMQFQGRAAEGLFDPRGVDGGMDTPGKKPRRKLLQNFREVKVGLSKSGLEERRFLAVRNHGCYLYLLFFFKLDQATHLSFPHTWRNGTGTVSGSSSGISNAPHYCAYLTSSPGK